ncbi:MAG: nicotinate (nicotinamide) nucleotide adenylyltransferase [Planctomycetota bacterium]
MIPIEPPIPADVHTLLLYGGTFDPPHRAHIELPEHARRSLGIDRTVYIPAKRSPHKDTGPIASDDDRVAMLHAAIGAQASVSRIEIDTTDDEPSYTVKTLERIRAAMPGVELRLLIGTDQAVAFHRWRQPRRIIELAEPVVLLRGDQNAQDVIEAMAEHWMPDELAAWKARFIDGPTIDVSATQARAMLAAGNVEGARTVLPEAVIEVIQRRGLYISA